MATTESGCDVLPLTNEQMITMYPIQALSGIVKSAGKKQLISTQNITKDVVYCRA